MSDGRGTVTVVCTTTVYVEVDLDDLEVQRVRIDDAAAVTHEDRTQAMNAGLGFSDAEVKQAIEIADEAPHWPVPEVA